LTIIRKTTIYSVTACLCLFTIGQLTVLGQESVTTKALKPVLPDLKPKPEVPSKASAVVPSKDPPTGVTYVATEAGLDRIQAGEGPRTLNELHAMEKQQEKVAAKITTVTVNVEQGSAQGSGVIITADGYILTAAHVAGKPGREAIIRLSNGEKVRARTLGTNRTMDAGLLQITTKSKEPWPYATLGRSKTLRSGQWVIAAGHPGGYNKERPAVIRIGRVLNNLSSTIVTDCALIGGDSGGPLFDLNGQLVGIHSRIGTETADNMHVPIDVYSDSWNRLAAGEAWGTLPGFQPKIGVEGRQGSNGDGPAEIAAIIQDSPAARYGLKVGDIITSFDGHAVNSFNDLRRVVSESLPGDLVEIRFLRQGKEIRRSLIIGVEGQE
jgi:serine protease Do